MFSNTYFPWEIRVLTDLRFCSKAYYVSRHRLRKNCSADPRSPVATAASDFSFCSAFERYTPDPYILAVGLTILTGLLAAVLAPKGSLPTILSGWYTGLFSILAFAFQVLLILVAGYALSTSRPVRSLLSWLASFGSTPRRAIVVTIVTVFLASFLNWGFGLVVAGLLTREIAKRIRIDFGWLVGGAYSGWMIFPADSRAPLRCHRLLLAPA